MMVIFLEILMKNIYKYLLYINYLILITFLFYINIFNFELVPPK